MGGGSLPGRPLESRALAVTSPWLGPDRLAAALRRNEPPIVARIDGGRTVLDVRTITEPQLDTVSEALARIAAGGEPGPAGEDDR